MNTRIIERQHSGIIRAHTLKVLIGNYKYSEKKHQNNAVPRDITSDDYPPTNHASISP